MIDALKATALITTLLFSGASYAANKIALICSGTETVDWQKESTNPLLEPDGLVIDLDGGVVVWRNVTIPIVKTSGVWIEFESKEQAEALDSHSYSGI